jgi:hypothetical protein
VDFTGYANYQNAFWEYAYFITEKASWIWFLAIFFDWVRFLHIDLDIKIKVRKSLKGLIGLFLIRILWEIVSIIKGYDFMLQKSTSSIYLILVSCYIFLVILWINNFTFWKQRGLG